MDHITELGNIDSILAATYDYCIYNKKIFTCKSFLFNIYID